MNPAGVLFGQHAQLDVSGSFAVTTANYLKLVGGGRFNANLGGGDVLTSAPVSAFGFLTSVPAPVSVRGTNTVDFNGNIVSGLSLNVAQQKSFSVVAGDIAVNGGTITGAGSRVNLVSVKSPGEVQLDATNVNSAVDVSQFASLGTINLTNLALIDTSGPGGGPVIIRGGNLYLNNSQILSETSSSIDGGTIDITTRERTNIVDGGLISSSTSGEGNSGNVTVAADSLLIDGSAAPELVTGISTNSDSGATGTAGDLSINVGQALTILGAGTVTADTYSNGRGGDLTIQAGSLLIDGSAASDFITGISSDSNSGATGAGGDIKINVERSLTMLGSGTITADTYSSGHGGEITVHASSMLIDGSAVPEFATYISADAVDGKGNGGNVRILVGNLFSIKGGGYISADTYSNGRGGDLTVQAGSLLIDGSAVPESFTGISTDSNSGATGRAGDLMIDVQGAVTVLGSGLITADTYSSRRGGDLTLHAGSLLIDGSAVPESFTGISTDSNSGATGRAGNLMIDVQGAVTVLGSGFITADTYSSGRGGDLTLQAGSLLIDGSAVPDIFTGISTDSNQAAGAAGQLVIQAGDLRLIAGGQISSSSYGSGNGGNINLTANSLLIDGASSPLVTGISASAEPGSSGNAGNVIVHAGNLKIVDAGEIQSSTFGLGNGGNVNVTANSLLIDGANSRFLTGISASAAEDTSGNAGNVVVHAGNLEIVDYGEIQSATFGPGDGGNVDVTANSILIDGGVNSAFTTGISASANPGSSGKAGNVMVEAGNIELIDYGEIASVTFGKGDGGSISVLANSLLIDAGANSTAATGILASAQRGSGGNAGSVIVQAANLEIINYGEIQSVTSGQGDGGSVNVTANSLLINGGGNSAFTTGIVASAESGSSGNAGTIAVEAGYLNLIDYGEIQSVTFAQGQGGNVNVTVNSLLINGGGNSAVATGILASAERGSSGNAGTIAVDADHLTLTNRGSISSSTFGIGDGGSVSVSTGSLSVDGVHSGISATAGAGSSGGSGDVIIGADSLSLENGGDISAASFTAAAAGSVQLRIGTLTVDSGSSISSANTGSGEAGSVLIHASGSVTLKHDSSISTLSDMSDAGSIEVKANGVIKLKDQSSVTVSGGHNGGDIHITTPDLLYLLNSSITATAGANGVAGMGGNITIDPQFIVLNNSSISANAAVGQGGNIKLISDFLFNSDLSNSNITATGTTNGTVNITAPALDLGSELITLPTSLLSAESQLQERCTALLRGDFSSFISIGRGGTEPAPEELQTTF